MGKEHVLALVGLATASFLVADPAAAGRHCRYDGRIFGQGDMVCIEISGRSRLARCEMVLNNASWTFLQEGCPTALLTPAPGALASCRRNGGATTAMQVPNHVNVP